MASSLNSLAFGFYKTGACEEAREALGNRRQAYGDEHPQVADKQMNLARCLRAMKQLKEAESLCRKALEIQTRMLGEDHLATAATMKDLGRSLTNAGHYEEGESALLSVLKILRGKFDGVPDGCDACPTRRPGDIFFDTVVDVSDVGPFVGVLLDLGSATAEEFCAANINGDAAVDGLDVEAFVGLILTP